MDANLNPCFLRYRRNLFDKIAEISDTIAQDVVTEVTGDALQTGKDELQNIVESFVMLQKQFGSSFTQLEKKASEICQTLEALF